VRCTLQNLGWANILQTLDGAAAGSGLVKGFTFLKGETFLYNPFDLYPISCIFAL
jgi:hypothetical protein